MSKNPANQVSRKPSPPRDIVIPAEQKSFADNLLRARNDAGLTQAELALRCGISQPHISQLEAGTWEPRLATIMALAKALGVEPARLLPTTEGEVSR